MPLSCKYIPQPILWKNPPHTGFFPETVRGPAHVKSSPDASGINRCSYLPFPAQTIIQSEVPAPSTFFASSPIPLSISYSDRDPPIAKPRSKILEPGYPPIQYVGNSNILNFPPTHLPQKYALYTLLLFFSYQKVLQREGLYPFFNTNQWQNRISNTRFLLLFRHFPVSMSTTDCSPPE